MPEGLDKLAGAIGDTLKTAPTIYEDTLQPTVQEVGKFVARIPRAINAAFSGLDKWILNKEYAIDETKKLLEEKLENIDPQKIVEPEAYVAVPAIQAISYSMNSEELRNLYANLLAKAMNYDTKDFVHPAYVNIINQMTPLDAKVLQFILEKPDHDFPIISLIARNATSSITLQPNITPMTISSIDTISISIENLSRNNLIYVTDDINSEGYDCIYNNKSYAEYCEIQQNNLTSKYPILATEKRNCILSPLGKSFCDICMS